MNRVVVWLAVVHFLAMGAGFLREAVLAYHFGTTAAADAFSLTLYYVDGVMAVVISGLSAYTLVPVFTRVAHQDGDEAGFRLLETCLLWAVVLGLPVVGLSSIAPSWLARLVAPDFSAQQGALLAGLVQLAVPTCALILLAAAMVGVLQGRARYTAPVYGRAAYSLMTAVALIVGINALGVRAGGLGLLIGAIAQLWVLVEALRRIGWRPQLPRLWHPGLSHALAAGLPTLLALLLTNILMGGVQRYLASGLPEGAFAAVNYAQRAVNLVSGLTMAVATVSLTELSVGFHEGGVDGKTLRLLRESLESGLFLLLPLSCLFFLVCEPIVTLLFQRGRYDIASLTLTVSCLRWLILAIVPGLLVAILRQACPAFGRPWRATAISAIWTTVTVGATAWLLPELGAAALTAAFTAGMMAAASASMIVLRDLVGPGFFGGMARYLTHMAGITALAAVPAVIVGRLLGTPGDAAAPGWSALTLALQTCAFVAVFGVVCSLLREPRWRALGVATGQVLGDVRRMFGAPFGE